jgi:hypothetical protein
LEGVDGVVMESVIVLGADRVGKTTAIRNSREYLEGRGNSVTVCHFSGVSPKHHSPVQQFTDTLDEIDNALTDYLIMDRFVPDTLFYEPYRYQLPPVPKYIAHEPESMLLEMSERVSMVIIEHEWNMLIRERHEEEVRQLHPDCTGYWLAQQVQKRRIEHEKYYEHLEAYVRKTTLICKDDIYRLPGHLFQSEICLDVPGIPVFG